MPRQIATLVVLFVLPLFAWAADNTDVCVLRPDLCSDHAEAPRPTARKGPGRRCRMPYQAYSVDDADLPLCRSSAPAPGRVPAAAPAAAAAVAPQGPAVTFESYMAANSHHPALSGKIPDHQHAFVEAKQSAKIDFPMDNVSTKENDNPLGSTPLPAGQQPVNPALPGAGTGGFSLPAGFDPSHLPAGIPAGSIPANLQPAGPPR